MLVGAMAPPATTSLVVLNSVNQATDVQAAIGALGRDLYEQNRNLVRLVPQCVMKVPSAFDGGDLSLFTPAEPCGCLFEKSVPSGSNPVHGVHE